MMRLNYLWIKCWMVVITIFSWVGQVSGQTIDTSKTTIGYVRSSLPYRNFYSVRDGLPHFYNRIKHHKPVTVAYLGGSITYNPGWRIMVSEFFKKRFPKEQFRFINAGIPSLGSLPDAFRLQRDVLDSGRIDLLFVEAAVNDSGNGTDSITQIRDLEGIIRHAKKSNPKINIILMSFADPSKLEEYASGKTPVAVHNHELVAQHYQLPSINLAKEVYEKIREGEFSWDRDFKSLHPAPFGQNLYFESIKSLIDACLNKADTHSSGVQAYRLPHKMNSYSFDHGEYYSVQNATIISGWRLINSWTPGDHVHTRKGFVHVPVLEATSPHAALKLSFTGTAIGFAVLAGPDAGMVEYSIDNGPFQKMDLYTRWSHDLYLPWYELFSGALKNKKHILHLRISSGKNPESKGTACRIVYFIVNK